MNPAASKPATLPAIDHLRGLAALGVAVFHVRVALWVGWSEIHAHPADYTAAERAAAWLATPAPLLGSLVFLFFVVSGFCVHRPEARRGGRLELRSYAVRRFLRIYPPYLAAAGLGCLVARLGWTLPGSAPVGGAALGPAAAMTLNYAAGGGAVLGANPSLWSLPVEMELYVAYPFFLWLARRWGWPAGLAVVAAVSLVAAAGFAAGWPWVAGNFALYWILWCGGAWLAERHQAGTLRAPPRWLGGAALAALGAHALLTWRHPHAEVLPLLSGLGYFWVLWLAVTRREPWLRRGSWADRAAGALGRWSYSLYLVHFPLFILGGGWWLARRGTKPADFLVALAACVAVVPLAWGFYRLVERPSHRWARRLAAAGGSRAERGPPGACLIEADSIQ